MADNDEKNVGPISLMGRDAFIGSPKITSDKNAKDLKPRAYDFLNDVDHEDFPIKELTAKYHPDGAAVFDGEKTVASYNFGNTLVVDPKYRKKGIGEELVYQWRTRFPGPSKATHRTKVSHAIQQKVWERINREGKAKGGAAFGPVDTDHPSFRSWFGRSVLHDNGKPVRLFHGTSKDKDFGKFNMSRHGVWLTTDPKEASSYAEQNDSQGYKADGWKMTKTNTASRVIPVYARVENPFMGEKPDHILQASNYKKAQSDWFDTLRSQGYDGWVPKSMNGNLVVALAHPGQIKSALSNTGEYGANADINKAEGGPVDDNDGVIAYHGSPHDFDQFDISKIGTGEGAQAYGHGLYFAESEPVAKSYRDALSSPVSRLDPSKIKDELADIGGFDPQAVRMAREELSNLNGDAGQTLSLLDGLHLSTGYGRAKEAAQVIRAMKPEVYRGRMYEVHIDADPERHMLDWDAPLLHQPEAVRRAFGWTPELEAQHRAHLKADTDDLAAALSGDADYSPKHFPTPHGLPSLTSTGGEAMQRSGMKPEDLSRHLMSHGVRGVRYFDGGSRSAGEGTRNYVVFDDKHVGIRRKYEQGGRVDYAAGGTVVPGVAQPVQPMPTLTPFNVDADLDMKKPEGVGSAEGDAGIGMNGPGGDIMASGVNAGPVGGGSDSRGGMSGNMDGGNGMAGAEAAGAAAGPSDPGGPAGDGAKRGGRIGRRNNYTANASGSPVVKHALMLLLKKA